MKLSLIGEGLVWLIALPPDLCTVRIVSHCNILVYGAAMAMSSPAPPPLCLFCYVAERDSASDKEKPINMMERIVNLQPDDSSQAGACCCSPSASERREYEASSLSSCTGNEMWN